MITTVYPRLVIPHSPINWSHPLAHGLVDWWLALSQWSGGTTLRDLTLRSNGTLTNMASPPTTTSGWNSSMSPPRTGEFGALAYDGTDDYVDVGSNSVLNGTTFTIALWFNPVVIGGAVHTLFGHKGDFHPRHISLDWQTTNKVTIGDENAAYILDFGTTFSAANTWYHVAWTYANGTNTGYTNGVADGSTSYTFGADYTGNYYISSPTSTFNGFIDDVRIYNRALSATEVQQLYTNALVGYPGLLHRARLPRFVASTVPIFGDEDGVWYVLV